MVCVWNTRDGARRKLLSPFFKKAAPKGTCGLSRRTTPVHPLVHAPRLEHTTGKEKKSNFSQTPVCSRESRINLGTYINESQIIRQEEIMPEER